MVKENPLSSFVSVLEALVAWLESEHVPHTTIGGIAVSLIAKPRATQDIDVVIWLDENRWELLLKAGALYGFIPRLSEALQFAKRSRVLLLKHQESSISIDISVGSLEFEREQHQQHRDKNSSRK